MQSLCRSIMQTNNKMEQEDLLRKDAKASSQHDARLHHWVPVVVAVISRRSCSCLPQRRLRGGDSPEWGAKVQEARATPREGWRASRSSRTCASKRALTVGLRNTQDKNMNARMLHVSSPPRPG